MNTSSSESGDDNNVAGYFRNLLIPPFPHHDFKPQPSHGHEMCQISKLTAGTSTLKPYYCQYTELTTLFSSTLRNNSKDNRAVRSRLIMRPRPTSHHKKCSWRHVSFGNVGTSAQTIEAAWKNSPIDKRLRRLLKAEIPISASLDLYYIVSISRSPCAYSW